MVTQKLTCSQCSAFVSFEGDNRGLCKVFNKVARTHHPQTSDCKNNLDEVLVTLYSFEEEICPEDGVADPVATEKISLFFPHEEITYEKIKDYISLHILPQPQFKGFYWETIYWANDPTHEF